MTSEAGAKIELMKNLNFWMTLVTKDLTTEWPTLLKTQALKDRMKNDSICLLTNTFG